MKCFFVKGTLLCSAIVLLSACANNTYSPTITLTPPDLYGRLEHAPTMPLVCAETVLNKTVNTSLYRELGYVKLNSHGYIYPPVYNDFVMQTIGNMGFFKEVATATLPVYINAKPRSSISMPDGTPWYDQRDPVTLPALRSQYDGRFLLLEANLDQLTEDSTGSPEFSFEIRAIDPKDGAILASFRHRSDGFLGVGMERHLFNPVFNALHDWLYVNAQGSTVPVKTIPKVNKQEQASAPIVHKQEQPTPAQLYQILK